MRVKKSRLWIPLLSAGVVACGLGASSTANATVILSFGQSVDGPIVTATENALDTKTSIVGIDVPVVITQYAGPGAPISAFLDFTLNSTAPAAHTLGQILEPFGGSFSFTSLSGDLGINYLSSVFTDFVFGTNGGSSLTLNSSQPPGSVVFTSDILDAASLEVPRALSLAFADVTPVGTIVGTSLQGFTSSVSGTVSAVIPVPEPAGLALFGVGLAALGVMQYRRATKIQPAVGRASGQDLNA